MTLIASLLSGLVFGLGLIVSGMASPAKVLAFLDIAGAWDPSLAFVMVGAVVTAFIGYRLVFKRQKPLTAASFQLPAKKEIDRPLLLGSAIFGIGWGLGGFCPGPALTAATLGAAGTYAFLPMMFAGMWLARALASRRVAAPA